MGNLLSSASSKEPTTVEECDSTWNTDSEGEDEEEKDSGAEGEQEDEKCGGEDQPETESDCSTTDLNIKPKRSFYAARDLYKYRHQYPQNIKDLRYQNDLCNLRFYMNKIPLKPDGVYIEEILNNWKGDYEKLEHNHTYIQWLFPLREQGLNFYAKELTPYEIEEFKKTKEAKKRFILAYKMMLDFFGLQFTDKNEENVSRAPNWQDRFHHLNESQHNYLRITRILKSLGELGYENFKFPLVKAFLKESIVENTIPNMKQSALEYFVYTVKVRKERRKLLRFASRHYQPSEHFIWGPPLKQTSGQNKAINNTTLNRSLKKNPQKCKEPKSEHSLEEPQSTSVDDKGVGLEQVEVNSQQEAEIKDDDGNNSENNGSSSEHHQQAQLQPVKDPTITSIVGEEDTEHGKENNVVSVIIADTTDKGNTDCLCNLSPGTSANADVLDPSGTEKEVELKDKESKL